MVYLRIDRAGRASWSGYSQHGHDTLPLPTDVLSGEEVLAFRDQAFLNYFTGAAYLESIRKKFGNNVVEHVQWMVEQPFHRKSDSAGKASGAIA